MSCSTSEFIKEFYSNVLTCEVLKIFYISILEACGSDDSSQKGCQKFSEPGPACLTKIFKCLLRSASRHLSRFGIKVDPKETLCVPSASQPFLMALQKGYFHSRSRSTLYLTFSPEVSSESLAY